MWSTMQGTVSAKPVRLGPRLHGYRVIREGLTGDETIVINGLMRVRPGVKVKPELVTLPPERRHQRARNEICHISSSTGRSSRRFCRCCC